MDRRNFGKSISGIFAGLFCGKLILPKEESKGFYFPVDTNGSLRLEGRLTHIMEKMERAYQEGIKQLKSEEYLQYCWIVISEGDYDVYEREVLPKKFINGRNTGWKTLYFNGVPLRIDRNYGNNPPVMWVSWFGREGLKREIPQKYGFIEKPIRKSGKLKRLKVG